MKKTNLLSIIVSYCFTACAQTTVFAPAGTFTSGVEGPVCDQWGNVFIVNYKKQGTIGKLTPDGKGELYIALPDSAIGNGLVFDSRGNLLVADYVGHRIWSIDTLSKKVDLYVSVPEMNQPNDITISQTGRLYASDPNWKEGTGNLWMIDTDKTPVLLEKGMGTTNGICLSPDEQYLYVNESVQRKVWKYKLDKEGGVIQKTELISFLDHGMDGMKCDVDGNIYITRYGAGEVVVVSSSGKILKTIKLKGQKPTNIAFGRKEHKTAYVTIQDDGSVETFQNDVSGVKNGGLSR